MLPLVLPPGPRRPELVSFSLALGVLLGVLVLLVSLVVGGVLALVPSTAIFLALATIGFLRPRLLVGPYRLWNRFGRRAASIAENWTLAVCYYVIFPVAGKAGSTFPKGKIDPAGSEWVARQSLPPSSLASLSGAPEGPWADRGWIRATLGWAGSSSNLWTFALLPFLILLRSFSYERDEVRLDTNYTLY